MPNTDVPLTVDDAIERIHDTTDGTIKMPNRILCQKNDKFWQVKKYEYAKNLADEPKLISHQSKTVDDGLPF